MTAARRSVAVRILGHEYRVRTESDPGEMQRVAAHVEETLARLRDRTGTVDSLDLAVMAALNLARDLLAERSERKADGESAERLRGLTDRVEAVLREAAAPAR
jgi:cell division protein ZapA (FtsZ GTPase activity inhibitor)